jgi:hypothetical protein
LAAYDPASVHLMLALLGTMTDDEEELQMWRECAVDTAPQQAFGSNVSLAI